MEGVGDEVRGEEQGGMGRMLVSEECSDRGGVGQGVTCRSMTTGMIGGVPRQRRRCVALS